MEESQAIKTAATDNNAHLKRLFGRLLKLARRRGIIVVFLSRNEWLWPTWATICEGKKGIGMARELDLTDKIINLGESIKYLCGMPVSIGPCDVHILPTGAFMDAR